MDPEQQGRRRRLKRLFYGLLATELVVIWGTSAAVGFSQQSAGWGFVGMLGAFVIVAVVSALLTLVIGGTAALRRLFRFDWQIYRQAFRRTFLREIGRRREGGR